MKRTTEEEVLRVLGAIVRGEGGYPPSPVREEVVEPWNETLRRLEETPRTPEDNQ